MEGKENKRLGKWMRPALFLAAVLLLAGAAVFVLTRPGPRGATLFRQGLLPASDGEKWGYIDETGVYAIPPAFDEARSFGENGLAPARQGDLWGFLDTGGVWAIPPAYASVGSFRQGLAPVMVKQESSPEGPLRQRWGYIDETGAYVLEPVYNSAESFGENGLAQVSVGRRLTTFVDREGKEISDRHFLDLRGRFSQGLVPVCLGKSGFRESWGYLNESGAVAIPGNFTDAAEFREGLAAASELDGEGRRRYGFIDAKGEWVIQPQFVLADSFHEGLAAAAVEDGRGSRLWGYVDRGGRWVIPPQFEEAGPFRQGVAGVRTGESWDQGWGFIDSAGRRVTEPCYDQIGEFSNGLAYVIRDRKLGYVNTRGEEVIPLIYEGPCACGMHGANFWADGYTVVKYQGLYGVMDTRGNLLVEPAFQGMAEWYVLNGVDEE